MGGQALPLQERGPNREAESLPSSSGANQEAASRRSGGLADRPGQLRSSAVAHEPGRLRSRVSGVEGHVSVPHCPVCLPCHKLCRLGLQSASRREHSVWSGDLLHCLHRTDSTSNLPTTELHPPPPSILGHFLFFTCLQGSCPSPQNSPRGGCQGLRNSFGGPAPAALQVARVRVISLATRVQGTFCCFLGFCLLDTLLGPSPT